MARIAQPGCGFCDIHCHILPNVDDGPDHLRVSVAMCREAVADGIRTIVATPHFNDTYRPDAEAVSAALESLRAAVADMALPLEILPGADVAPVKGLLDLLAESDRFTIAGRGKYILFEPPRQAMPDWVSQVIFELRIRGLGVIITHPERNAAVQGDPNIILPLVQSGVMLQLTADSVVGNFGDAAERCAASLLKMNAAHFIASDAHSAVRRVPHLADAAERAARYLGEQEAVRLVSQNPYAAVRGEAIALPEPRPLRSWLSMFSLTR